jgi:hypothetical protein
MLDDSWIHYDPHTCHCESRRGRERIAEQESAERARRDLEAAAWKHGVALFNLPHLESSAVWTITRPVPLLVLALLYQEADGVRRYLLSHSGPLASDAAVVSSFERWADQGRVFSQHRVAGSFGSGSGR